MNWDAIGAVGEILGAVAVLVTLVYLARQISLSNRIAIASSEIDLRNSLNSLNQAIYTDSELAELFTKSQSPEYEFEPTEQTKMVAFTRHLLNAWLSVEVAYSRGMAPEETYNVIFDNISEIVEVWPASRPLYKQHLDTYRAMSQTEVFKFLKAELEKSESGT